MIVLETIGLKGMWSLWTFGSAKNLAQCDIKRMREDSVFLAKREERSKTNYIACRFFWEGIDFYRSFYKDLIICFTEVISVIHNGNLVIVIGFADNYIWIRFKMLYAPCSSLTDIRLRKVIVEIDIVSNCLIQSFSEGYKVQNMKARSMGTVIFGKDGLLASAKLFFNLW